MNAMRNIILFVSFATVMYGGYNIMTSGTASNDIREKEIAIRNESKKEFDQKLAEINKDLGLLVAEQEGKVSFGPGTANETSITTQERIVRNLALVKNIMKENKAKIAKLDGDRNRLILENQSLTHLIDQDSEMLAEYETELDSLYDELSYQDMRVEELEEKMDLLQVHNELLQIQSDEYKDEMNTAYFVCKNKKTLIEQHIVESRGGVLGIGKRTYPNASADEEKFTRIDKKKFSSIAIRGEKPELVSLHPKGSYEFRTENNMNVHLHILDPEKFWSHTRYAIVSVH